MHLTRKRLIDLQDDYENVSFSSSGRLLKKKKCSCSNKCSQHACISSTSNLTVNNLIVLPKFSRAVALHAKNSKLKKSRKRKKESSHMSLHSDYVKKIKQDSSLDEKLKDEDHVKLSENKFYKTISSESYCIVERRKTKEVQSKRQKILPKEIVIQSDDNTNLTVKKKSKKKLNIDSNKTSHEKSHPLKEEVAFKEMNTCVKKRTGLDKTSLKVQNLSLTITKDEFQEIFSQFGTIVSFKIMPTLPGKSTNAAFCHMKKEIMCLNAIHALRENPIYDGSYLSVSFAKQFHVDKYLYSEKFCHDQHKKENLSPENGIAPLTGEDTIATNKKSEKKEKILDKCNMIVRNIPHSITEGKLQNFFSPFGEVKSIKIMPTLPGKNTNIGFCRMKNEKMCANAINMLKHKPILDDTTLIIGYAEIRQVKKKEEKLAIKKSKSLLPLYYGWFLTEKSMQIVLSLAEKILHECLDCVTELNKYLKEFYQMSDEEVLSFDKLYPSERMNKGCLHATAYYCGKGTTKYCDLYQNQLAIKSCLKKQYKLCMYGVSITPFSIGGCIRLNKEQMKFWKSDKGSLSEDDLYLDTITSAWKKNNMHLQANNVTLGQDKLLNVIYSDYKIFKDVLLLLNEVTESVRSECLGKSNELSRQSNEELNYSRITKKSISENSNDDKEIISLISTMTDIICYSEGNSEHESFDDDYYTIRNGCEAHVTLGSGHGIAPVQTRKDFLTLLHLNKSSQCVIYENNEYIIRYFGNGSCLLSFREPILLQSVFDQMF